MYRTTSSSQFVDVESSSQASNSSSNVETVLRFLAGLKLELDRYIGQPIYIGRYQGQTNISYRCLPPIKYRLSTISLNCLFLRASTTALDY